jgi:signal transduction histidine kinase
VVASVLVLLCLALLPYGAWGLTEGYQPSHADTAFYAFGLSATVFSAVVVVAYRAYAWLGYVVFSLLMLLTVASMDGLVPYLLGGGEFVLWVVPFLIYTLSTAYGYVLVAFNIDPTHALARLRPVMLFLAVLAALLAVSSAFWLRKISLSAMWVPANFLFFTMLCSQIIPPLTWSEINARLARLIRLFPLVVGGYFVVAHAVDFLGPGLAQADINWINRIGMSLSAAFSLAIVLWRAFVSRQAQELAEERALLAARKEVELQAELLAAERDYRRAQAVAAQHQSRLATVSHDLKQPIAALRLAVENMPVQGESRTRLSQAVDYIGSLSLTYLDELRDESGDRLPASPETSEPIAAQVFAASLNQMFEADAAGQGIRLNVRCGELSLRVDPLPTMRIMSNLLGYAIAHAQAERILVAFRRRGNQGRFEVYDNGVGMTSDTLTTLMEPGTRGPESSGQGLGMSIVGELCREQGFVFAVRSEPGRGSCFSVLMPGVGSQGGRS